MHTTSSGEIYWVQQHHHRADFTLIDTSSGEATGIRTLLFH